MVSRLHKRLTDYYELTGEDIQLVYHPTQQSSWERTTFTDEKYDEEKAYNHRTVFTSEVVLEYDDGDKKLNYDLAMRASKKMTQEHIQHAVWTSGNKSTHIHAFFNFSDAENIRYLKRLILQFFGNVKHLGTWYEPDMALTSPNHLIRAEHGIHEKTQQRKAFVDKSRYYPRHNSIPEEVWTEYDTTKDDISSFEDNEELVESVAESDAFRWLLDPSNIREIGDGKKRGVFVLGNILYQATDKSDEDIINFCQEWYEAAGGRDYKEKDIRQTLEANFQKGGYTPGFMFIGDLMSDIGMEKLLKEE